MFSRLNAKAIFPEYTFSVNHFSPNTTEEVFFPLISAFQKKNRNAQQHCNLFTGGRTQRQGDAEGCTLHYWAYNKQHSSIRGLYNVVITPSGVQCAEHKAALPNTFETGIVYMSSDCHFRQKKLKPDLLGIKNSPWSDEQPVTSMRSHHGWSVHFPQAKKKNIKLLLINNKGKLKKTPSSIFTLFQYRK